MLGYDCKMIGCVVRTARDGFSWFGSVFAGGGGKRRRRMVGYSILLYYSRLVGMRRKGVGGWESSLSSPSPPPPPQEQQKREGEGEDEKVWR